MPCLRSVRSEFAEALLQCDLTRKHELVKGFMLDFCVQSRLSEGFW